MNKMPDIDVEFFLPEELVVRWSKKYKEKITLEEIIGYGRGGSLKFMVANPTLEPIPCRMIWKEATPKDEDIIIPNMITHVPITKMTLEKILDSNKRIQISSFFEEIAGNKMEFEIYSPVLFDYGNESLRIHRYEVLRFENQLDNEKPILPAYLDPESPYFAKEIAIAIEAHTAIFIKKEGNQSQSLTSRVGAWIDKNYREDSAVSKTARDRIVPVVLPKKK